MPRVTKVVFKELTASDFYWINQPGLGGGGGQSYIDLGTDDVSLQDWQGFFEGVPEGNGASGPFWRFSVRNLGANTTQSGVKVGQRRATTFSVRSQKLPEHSARGRRLHAWSPHYTDFPALPENIGSAVNVPGVLIAGLRVFLIRDEDGHFWAGWRKGPPPVDLQSILKPMFASSQGIIEVSGSLELDPVNPHWPFIEATPSEGPDWDDDDELDTSEPGISYSVQKVRKRDKAAADSVRKLYTKCQISGDEFVFLTKSGKPYLEVHHLIPLGKGGADAARNMIVVCPQIHKMLHHAEVSDFDLANIANNELPIKIAGKAYVIKWHPQHAANVLAHNQP